MAGAIVAAAAGCSDTPAPPTPLATGTPTPTPTAPTPTPTISLGPEQAAVAAEVLAVYRDFRTVEDELSLAPQPREEVRALLTDHLASPLLTQVQAALAAMYEDDLARPDAPAAQVDVVQVRLADSPHVTLRECLDTRDAPLVHADSGEPVGDDLRAELYMAAHPPGRHVRVIEAARYDDGRWLLNGGQFVSGETC